MAYDLRLSDGIVTLRRYRSEDREPLVAIADNPMVSRFLTDRFPNPYTIADADIWLALVRTEVRTCNFAIEYEGKIVGGAGLEPMEDIHAGTSGVGYWLGLNYWKKGIATRALKILSDYAFDELLFVRLQALVFADNPASARVLEKCGYVQEGVMRSHVRKHGVICDAYLYARLRKDIPAPQ